MSAAGVWLLAVKHRIGVVVALALACLALSVATGWGALVLFYLGPGSAGIRTVASWSFMVIGLAASGALFFRRARVLAATCFAVAFALALIVWESAMPSNDRDWQPEVAVLPYADIDGDLVTVHNIRNFDYRTETDFTPAYYDRTFDLRHLDRVDLVAAYWMGPAIAHLFVSFRLRGRLPDHFRRGAQGPHKALWDGPRLLSPVRTGLHRSRRARRHPGADELPGRTAGRRLSLSADGPDRERPPLLPRLHARYQ